MPWYIPAILTAILWGICYTSIEPVVRHIDKTTYIIISASVSLFIYGIWSLYNQNLTRDINYISENPRCATFLFIAIVSGVIANFIALKAIESSGASLAAALEISYPFWCMLFAYLLFNEAVSWQAIFGSLVTFAGIYLVATSK